MDYERPGKHLNIQNVSLQKLYKIMPNSNIHPKWFSTTEILCDGKPLCKIGSTKSQLQIDIWLANHPFYTKSQVLVDSEGRVEQFMKKYGLEEPDQ